MGTADDWAACAAFAAACGDLTLEYCRVSVLTIAAVAETAIALRTTVRRVCGRMVDGVYRIIRHDISE
jgi:hypothetical protein